MKNDRFKKLATNYGELIVEVFAKQGLDYNKLETLIFEKVAELEPNFRSIPILDIGIGDGKTSKAFVKVDCQHLTGIDLNPQMLAAARKNLGETTKLLKMDATNMNEFSPGQFPIVVAAHAIHNIPIKTRVNFWKEVLRLSPKLMVFSEKITDSSEDKHQASYKKELCALKEVYGEKYCLEDVLRKWVKHYEYDDTNRLYVSEIEENLSSVYHVSVVFETGMYKTVIARRR